MESSVLRARLPSEHSLICEGELLSSNCLKHELTLVDPRTIWIFYCRNNVTQSLTQFQSELPPLPRLSILIPLISSITRVYQPPLETYKVYQTRRWRGLIRPQWAASQHRTLRCQIQSRTGLCLGHHMTEFQASAANVRWRYFGHGIFSVQVSWYCRSKTMTLLFGSRIQIARIWNVLSRCRPNASNSLISSYYHMYLKQSSKMDIDLRR